MNKSKFKMLSFLMVSASLFFISCSVFTKKSDVFIIDGSYKLLSEERITGLSDSSFVSGYVFDAKDKKPIPYANIQVIPIKKGISTKEDGYFELMIPQGKYKLEVESLGNKVITKGIDFRSNHSTKLNFFIGVDIMYESSEK